MNKVDREYFALIDLVLKYGQLKSNRTGTKTLSICGGQARYDFEEGFPILTTKKVSFHNIAHELLWFLKGDTNIKYLVDNNVKIWNEWPYKKYTDILQVNAPIDGDKWLRNNGDGTSSMYTQDQFVQQIQHDPEFAQRWGDIGEGAYGRMWRDFPVDHIENGKKTLGVDQITTALNKLKLDPDDRRVIVSAWHPFYVEKAALPPCHCFFQFYTDLDKNGKRRLSCHLYQRSADLFLGVPYNISSYCLLIKMFCRELNMVPGELVHSFGDLHIYENHLDQIKEQRKRYTHPNLPTLILNPRVNKVLDFEFQDILLENYESAPAIKAPVAV